MVDDALQARPWVRIALVAVLVFEMLGWASGYLSQSGYGNSWFDALQKPSFMPPGWLFGVVWPILYAMLGVAVAMIIALPPSPKRTGALTLFGIQMALNFAWSPVFFALHDIELAKYIIIMMVVLSAIAAGQFFRLRPPAGVLMIPYLAWLVFATTLNTVIGTLNPGASQPLFG
ncbi:tryptophan-rich sensory protein [Sphingomonas sabuli]|uniref:Tryptophan-rich sensory protein n=1 Tax=Sphingomonas sabuli TaxID=2764186 RepID=A0A7G9L493_9SPHN|nr:TspO/MBR family protein [Sphingomonas sabuli]QNM83442.1 tryptophan-rich sensory protein [Sphingomonas sabuli]